jgi:ubiquinone/menaquinone biosynthesis C-methylase UbiE
MGLIEQKIGRQRVDERQEIDASGLEYHVLQWESPKQSTLAFERFVGSTLSKSKNVIDLGAGAGAATAYIANKNPAVKFTAFDYSVELTELGKKIQADKKINNLDFEVGDWYNLNLSKNYDGCISLQTLSWLPDYRAPIIEIFQKITPDFLALTSLFYEGDITCRIEVEECTRNNRKSFYNIYSLPAICNILSHHFYLLFNLSV